VNLDELLDHAADWTETIAPWTAVNQGLRLTRDVIRYASLLWMTRGCTPRERALAFAAMHRSRRQRHRTR
jgi:sulfur relay (sulfurtransferase) DsrC/TusE family protein